MQEERIRWLRVLLFGFLAELALMIVATPIALVPSLTPLLNAVMIPAGLVLFILFGYWAARPQRKVAFATGLLVGVTGVILYNGLVLGAEALPGAPPPDWAKLFSPAYLLTHALKIVGGAIGGWLASRRAQPA